MDRLNAEESEEEEAGRRRDGYRSKEVGRIGFEKKKKRTIECEQQVGKNERIRT